MQVLGLSNYSTDPSAADLRQCIKTDQPTAHLALDFAQKRLRSMWHVGTYENLRPSLASLATSWGVDVTGSAYRSNTAHAFSYDGEGEDDKARSLARSDCVTAPKRSACFAHESLHELL